MARKRRYELHLPVNYNDGRPVSDEVFHQARVELIRQFDGLTVIPQTVIGVWVHEGRRYEDQLARFVVDVDDTPDNLCFITNFKAKLLEWFEQVEIYITSYPVDTI